MSKELSLVPVGRITRRGETLVTLEPQYREALIGLEDFSHCHVIWWAGYDFDMGIDPRTILKARLPYANDHEAGVFGCRSPFRPNLIAITVCPIIRVDVEKGSIALRNIDAFDDTLVLDIKPYYACSDRVKTPSEPSWLPDWGAWVPDEGIGLTD